mgnify:CR=1 FL=1
MTSRHSPLAVTLILVLLSLRGGIALAQGGLIPIRASKSWRRIFIRKPSRKARWWFMHDLGRRAHQIDLDVFNKRFPGINTTYWQGTRSEIIARTLTEFQGDQKPLTYPSEGRRWFRRAERSSPQYCTGELSDSA